MKTYATSCQWPAAASLPAHAPHQLAKLARPCSVCCCPWPVPYPVAAGA